jgi:hypothetical protein
VPGTDDLVANCLLPVAESCDLRELRELEVVDLRRLPGRIRAIGVVLILRTIRAVPVVLAVSVISTAAATTAPSSRGTVTADGLSFVASASA